MARPPKSDHFDGRRFHNVHDRTQHGLGDVIKMLRTSERARWPEHVPIDPKLRLDAKLASNQVAVTLVNHATVLLQWQGFNILTDPVWSERCSPVSWAGPKRVHAPGIGLDELPPIDLIVVSHNHYDHLDKTTLKILEQKFSPQVAVAYGDKRLLHGIGLKQVEELEWWQAFNFKNLKITFAPTQHFSSRGIHDRNASLWGSYMLQCSGQSIYFGGDAGYSPHFSEIKTRLGAPDLSLIPIGAYEPRWFMKVVHMNPAEAVQAHLDLGSKKSVAIHHGTFQLTDEAIDQPKIDLQKALVAARLEPNVFEVVEPGQTQIYTLT